MTENELSGIIVDAAIEVHRTLGGSALLERVYEEALVWDLRRHGLSIERQKVVPFMYKGERLATDLRLDLLVEGKVLVECKASRDDSPLFEAQALTYLRLSEIRLAPVINFGKRFVKDGIHRVVNGL